MKQVLMRGVEHGVAWELRAWPAEAGALLYAVIALETRMGYTQQTVAAGASRPARGVL
jgi:hypothetical protein